MPPSFTPGQRSIAQLLVTDEFGVVQKNKAVAFFEDDESTAFDSNVFAAKTGGSALPSLTTDNEGYLAIYTEIANTRTFKYSVAGDNRKIAGAFQHDPRDLVTLTQAQTITGVKTLGSPVLQTPTFSGTATGLQVNEIKNTDEAVAVRLKGTLDTTVTGTWTATNGSPNVTASGNLTTAILRDQSVKIVQSSQTLRVTSCLHSAGTTTIILSSNYSGVTGTVTLLKDDDEVLDLKNGFGGSWFKIDSKGNFYTYGTMNIQADHHQDSSDDDTWSNGLFWDQVHRRMFIPNSWFVTSIGDPADLVIRYAEGSGVPDASPTQVPADANIGALYWMAYHGAGWGYRSASIHGWTTQTATASQAGGRLEFRTTPNGAIVAREQWDMHQDGSFRVRNNANSAYIVALSGDSGDNLNIGKDDTLNVIQMWGPVDLYASVASAGTAMRLNSAAGILLPAVDPPTANYATRRSINHVVGTVVYTAGVPALAGDYNCASVTDQGTGDAIIVVDTDFANVNYALVHAAHDSANRHQTSTLAKAVGSFRIQVVANGGDVLTDLAGAQNSLDFIASGVQ